MARGHFLGLKTTFLDIYPEQGMRASHQLCFDFGPKMGSPLVEFKRGQATGEEQAGGFRGFQLVLKYWVRDDAGVGMEIALLQPNLAATESSLA